jgi:hypothetical protein
LVRSSDATADRTSNVAARRISAIKAKAAPAGARQRQSITGILAQRERLVAEVARLRGDEDSQFVENAQQLLTRWWSTASWNARAELLKSANWLIRLEKGRKDQVASSA